MAERRKRIADYVGPDEWVPRERLAKLEKTGQYVVEEKKDGFWVKMLVSKGVIVRIETRTGEVLGGAHTAGLLRNIGVQKHTGVLVGELVPDTAADGSRSGQRRVHLFDVIEWEGHDLRDLPLSSRRPFLEAVHSQVAMQDRVLLVERRAKGFTAFYDEILARKGEGLVIKRIDSKHRAANADGKIDAWLRCKPLRTVDYIVVGHGAATKGTPNLKLGLWKAGKLVEVMTATFPNCLANEGLKPADCVSSIVEVEGYEIWNTGVVRSGHVRRIRTDKFPEDCTYEAAMKA